MIKWLEDAEKLFIQPFDPSSCLSSPLFCFTSSTLGVVSLSQALCSSDDYSNSLLHLDLSKNPGVLSGEDATVRDASYAECLKGNGLMENLIHILGGLFPKTFCWKRDSFF